MSGHDADIVFGDISYREPRKVRRPDRDRTRACLVYEVARPDDLPIFLDMKPADAIERHALRDTSVELGGILLGQECVDDETGEPFVWITEALEARHYENTQASFTYTHDSWAEITRERDEKHPDLDIVGWYHTHPDFGVFLSGHDLFIQHHFFGQPLQVAYVVDPVRQTRGFFQWRDGQMEPVGGFHLTAERARRPALARFVHDLEQFPTPETGEGVLSPRLEAELIAMLNRPHPAAMSAPPAAQTGLLYGVGGMIVGALALAGGLWLSNLARSIQEQADSLRTVEKAVTARLSEAETARVSAKEQALDALLRDIRVGATRESFLDAYKRAVDEKNEARKDAEALATEKAALTVLGTTLRQERATLDERLAREKERAAKLKDAAEKLQKENTAELDALNDKVQEQETILKESKAGTLFWKYSVAWYVAAAALAGCVLLGLGLVWALGQEVLPPPVVGPKSDDPPHTIA